MLRSTRDLRRRRRLACGLLMNFWKDKHLVILTRTESKHKAEQKEGTSDDVRTLFPTKLTSSSKATMIGMMLPETTNNGNNNNNNNELAMDTTTTIISTINGIAALQVARQQQQRQVAAADQYSSMSISRQQQHHHQSGRPSSTSLRSAGKNAPIASNPLQDGDTLAATRRGNHQQQPQQQQQPPHRVTMGKLVLSPPDEGDEKTERSHDAPARAPTPTVDAELCLEDMQSTMRMRVQERAEIAFLSISKRLGASYAEFTEAQHQQQQLKIKDAQKNQQGQHPAMVGLPRIAGMKIRPEDHWSPIGGNTDAHQQHLQRQRERERERQAQRQKGLFYESDSDDAAGDNGGQHNARTLSRKAIEEEFQSLWNSKSRVRLRLNAARTELVMLLIIFGNFILGYSIYIGKGKCIGQKWTPEQQERACSRAIQSDGVMMLAILSGAFFNPTRLRLFLPLYVVLLGIYFGIKWIPGLVDVNLVYYNSAVVVFTAEALVCVGLVWFHERNARAECKLNIRRYVKNRESAQVRRQAERTVGAQVPVEVLRMAMVMDKRMHQRAADSFPGSPSNSSLSSNGGRGVGGEPQLWGWSERLTYGCVTLDGFSAWTLLRGPSQIVELTQAVLNLFDRVRMRCISSELHAPIPKAHRFGDCYSVFLIPPTGAIQDVREAVEVAAGFALLCITEGTDLIKRRFQNEVTWGNAA
ncbi:transmembrane protein, putative, partial [Bodo saltans]